MSGERKDVKRGQRLSTRVSPMRNEIIENRENRHSVNTGVSRMEMKLQEQRKWEVEWGEAENYIQFFCQDKETTKVKNVKVIWAFRQTLYNNYTLKYLPSSGTMADCRKNNLCSPWPSAVRVLSLWVSFWRTFHRNAIIPHVLCVWTCSYVSGSCNSARVFKTFVATHFSVCDLHSIEGTDHIWYIPHLLMIIWTASSFHYHAS